ncbi:hypothetical protein Dimus_003857 [Dionaea muscipula]
MAIYEKGIIKEFELQLSSCQKIILSARGTKKIQSQFFNMAGHQANGREEKGKGERKRMMMETLLVLPHADFDFIAMGGKNEKRREGIQKSNCKCFDYPFPNLFCPQTFIPPSKSISLIYPFSLFFGFFFGELASQAQFHLHLIIQNCIPLCFNSYRTYTSY